VPYAINNGIRIYYEIEGNGPPLVLAHGFTGSIENWKRYGHVAGLKGAYRLILVDARGHGKSDKPTAAEDYRRDIRARDITSVLEFVGIDRAHFVGFSMGGETGLSLMREAPERLASAILMGAEPYGGPSAGNSAVHDAMAAGPEALIELMERSGRKLPDWRRQIILDADFRAWMAYMTAYVPANVNARPPRPELAAAAREFDRPCLVMCGDQDENYEGAKRLASEMPDATFVGFPGLDHGGPIMRSDLSLPHVERFLERVTRPASERGRAPSARQ
jgi:pimeloyl-ACP methyl ester carboxylesterase